MRPLTMLVTSEGDWVFEGSSEFFAALGDPDPDYDSALFAVKNLGFIRFETVTREVVEIELHPRNVELPALLAVQQQILSSDFKFFRIKYFDSVWCSEITSSAEQAVSRLSELCVPAFSPPPSEKFLAEAQDFGSLLAGKESPLRLMAQKWRMSFANFDSSVIGFAIEHHLLSRMMVVGVKPGATEPVFRFIGDGFKWLDESFQLFGRGEEIVNQPDREYGYWVSEFYKSVARTGQPRYDRVTATILVELAPPGAYRTRYERLLLPWKTSTREVFVTLLSMGLGNDAAGRRPVAGRASSPFKNSVKSS